MLTKKDSRWFAIRVRSRCEKLSAADLAVKGYEVCSATAPQRRIWSDRVRTVEMPLFPGYIFSRFEPARRIEVEGAAGVVSIVRFGNRECPVDDDEIEAVRAVLRSGAEVFGSPYFGIGTRVRVRFGPLAGAQGVLVRVKNRHRLVVSVGLLQRSVAVEVDELMVEPLRRTSVRTNLATGVA